MKAKKTKIDAFKKKELTSAQQLQIKGGRGPYIDPVG